MHSTSLEPTISISGSIRSTYYATVVPCNAFMKIKYINCKMISRNNYGAMGNILKITREGSGRVWIKLFLAHFRIFVVEQKQCVGALFEKFKVLFMVVHVSLVLSFVHQDKVHFVKSACYSMMSKVRCKRFFHFISLFYRKKEIASSFFSSSCFSLQSLPELL